MEANVYKIHRKESGFIDTYYMLLGNDANLQKVAIISAYHLIFIVAQVFQFVLCIDAVFRQDTIQIIGLGIFNFLSLCYSVVQLWQTSNMIVEKDIQTLRTNVNSYVHHASMGLEIAIIVVMAVLAITFAFQAWHLFQEFGWRIYKKIGADLNIRRMYRLYQIFVTILKFGIFVFLAFAGQLWYLFYYNDDHNNMILHTVISISGSILIFVVGFWAARVESRYGIYAFVVGVVGTMTYLIYYLAKIYNRNIILDHPCKSSTGKTNNCDLYTGARIFLTLFAVITLLMGVALLATSFFILKNFGKGLKIRLQRNKDHTDYELGNGGHAFSDPHLRDQRWSIE
ncbi:hypothetical protein BDF19DRAFT_417421 [Syncephalis fuscata]|nr:hypothetical protein BDF19DRAFT_417421 [Syncephalis fuscata]